MRPTPLDLGATQRTMPSARVFRSGALSIANLAAVTWDTATFDPFGMWNGSRLIVPAGHGGEWELEGQIGGAVITADNYWSCFLYRNGANIQAGNIEYQRGAAAGPYANLSARARATDGDYFELVLATNNGTTALALGSSVTFLSARRIA